MPPVLVSARELARQLTVRYETILHWAALGKIPSLRDSRHRVLFNLDAVLKALRAEAPPRPEGRSAGGLLTPEDPSDRDRHARYSETHDEPRRLPCDGGSDCVAP